MSLQQVNDLELAKFYELAGEVGVKVFLLHPDNWCAAVANQAALPGTGNTLWDIRMTLDTGEIYRWDGAAWQIDTVNVKKTGGTMTGTLVINKTVSGMGLDINSSVVGATTYGLRVQKTGVLTSASDGCLFLDITNATSTLAKTLYANNSGTSGSAIYGKADNGAYGMIIESGKVGIGVVTPVVRAEIVDTAAGVLSNVLAIRNNSTATGSEAAIAFKCSTAQDYTDLSGLAKISAIRHNTVGGGVDLYFQVYGQERMRIDYLGNVGINTAAAQYKLHVNGNFGIAPGASVTPVNNGDVVFQLTSNTSFTIKAKGADAVVRTVSLTLA